MEYMMKPQKCRAKTQGGETAMLVESIELKEGTEVQWVGVYVLKWRSEWGQPTVGFRELDSCKWNPEYKGARIWETSCRELATIELYPGNMKYCPFCGHPIEMIDTDE